MAETKEPSIYPALLAVQKELPKLSKDAENPFHKNKYVTLYNLLDVVLPILNKHGLVLMQTVDGDSLVTSLIDSKTDADVTASMPLLLKSEDPQAQGSAITYARRYSLMAMLGLVGKEEDDDANKATEAAGTMDAPPSKAQMDYLKNLVVGFSKGKVKEDNIDPALKELFGVQKLSEITKSDVSNMINEIKLTKKVPMDFDDNERDYDREDK